MRPERAAEDGEGVVDVVTVPVEVDEGAGGVVLVYVAGEGAETFGGFDLLVRWCERRWRRGEREGRREEGRTTDEPHCSVCIDVLSQPRCHTPTHEKEKKTHPYSQKHRI